MTNLFIPVIIGTNRPKNYTSKVARFLSEQLVEHGVQTELIDVADYNFDVDSQVVDSARYEPLINRADGILIVTPEYNHTYPGILKTLLDTQFENYFRKSVIVAGVSSGPFGGVRAIDSMSYVIQGLGLIPSSFAFHFSHVKELFDENGTMLPEQKETYIKRTKKAFEDFIWLTKTLKYGRDNF